MAPVYLGGELGLIVDEPGLFLAPPTIPLRNRRAFARIYSLGRSCHAT